MIPIFRRPVASLLALVVISACSSSPHSVQSNNQTSVDVANLFSMVSYDYEVMATGNELAEHSDLVIVGELLYLAPGLRISDPVFEDNGTTYMEMHINVSEVLSESAAQVGSDIIVLLPLVQEVEKLLESSTRATISGEAILYLDKLTIDPETKVTGAREGIEYFVPVSPQGFILGDDDKRSIAVLEQGVEIIGNLDTFKPTDAPFPMW